MLLYCVEVTYTLSRGSTGSSTTRLSTASSLSLLTRRSRQSLHSSWALEEKGKVNHVRFYLYATKCCDK